MTLTCLHCARTMGRLYARGLCSKCYRVRTVRALYPPRGEAGRAGAKGYEPEPTEAEVDALVAEQMANLPDWWSREEARNRGQ
jgi:hypothetical protein